MNYYRDEEDCIGWHCDDEPIFGLLDDCICVVTLSLGETRQFEIRSKKSRQKPYSFPLKNGNIAVMSGLFQKYYEHRIPQESGASTQNKIKARVSLTWRWIVHHNCKKHRKKKKDNKHRNRK
jgi:alkylated DNA repair dioxygenase AlkB